MTQSYSAPSGEFSLAGRTTVDGVRVVTLAGDLDQDVRARVEEALTPPADSTQPHTVADLSGVTFMDSSGINVLILAHQAAEAAGGWLRVAGAQTPVMRVMEMVGLDTVIRCCPTVQQALEP